MLKYQFDVVVFKVHILIVTPTKVRLREKIKKWKINFISSFLYITIKRIFVFFSCDFLFLFRVLKTWKHDLIEKLRTERIIYLFYKL